MVAAEKRKCFGLLHPFHLPFNVVKITYDQLSQVVAANKHGRLNDY